MMPNTSNGMSPNETAENGGVRVGKGAFRDVQRFYIGMGDTHAHFALDHDDSGRSNCQFLTDGQFLDCCLYLAGAMKDSIPPE